MLAKKGLPASFSLFSGLVFFCFFLFAARPTQAASGSYGWSYAWARSNGSLTEEYGGQDVAMDSGGNIYITGAFGSTVDFNTTGEGDEDIHSASGDGDYNDVFITKYNADGSYGWTKTFGSTGEDYGQGIATDSDNNVYVTGYFQSQVNFNANGTDNHTAAGGSDIFITKYTSSGSYGWTRTIGTSGEQIAYAIAVDNDNNVIVLGKFSGTVDFDATDGTDNHASSDGNIFITKYGSDGSYQWSRTFGNSTLPLGIGDFAITSDSYGYIYATSHFGGSADFDGSSGVDNHISSGDHDIFITRLSPDGTYKWTQTIGGTGDDQGSGITTDGNGNVLVTGYYSGAVDFDTTIETDEHTAIGGKDLFILKLKENSRLVWVKSIGGTTIYDWGNDIASDEYGNIFITGGFMGTVDFDAGDDTDERTAGPGGDYFISKYNADGTYGWTRNSLGSTESDSTDALGVVADSKNVYLTGYYAGSVDFNDSEIEDLHTSYDSTFDFYLVKYTDDTPNISDITTNPAADSSSVTWTTNQASLTQVEYGLSQYFSQATSESDTPVTSHSETVSDLHACARYHYRVLSADSDDNKAISTRRAFNTSGCLASSVTGGTDAYTETSGGTLEFVNGQSTATILAPSGYFDEGAVIQINTLDANSVPSAPSDLSLAKGNFYNLLAVSDSDNVVSSFDQPITFTINYGADTQSSYNETTLDIYKYNGSSWEKQNCTVDSVNNTITCSLESFSVYGVFGQETTTGGSTTFSQASASVCTDTAPGTSNIIKIDLSATQATLTYTSINKNNNNYYISFSKKANTYEHGTFTGQTNQSGVLTYSVNFLKPNTVYYFRVRGQNGCMPGGWSSETKVRTKLYGVTSTTYYDRGTQNNPLTVTDKILDKGKLINKQKETSPTPVPQSQVVGENIPAGNECSHWWCMFLNKIKTLFRK